MNYLAHLLLSENSAEARTGSLLADFINISNKELILHFCSEISSAVIQHREIDQYTDAHEDVTSAIKFFFPRFRHYSRIIVDILFDHYLSIHWNSFCPHPMDCFVESVYNSFKSLPNGMPQKFEKFICRFIQYDLLRAYLTLDDLKEVFERVDKRFKNPVGLKDAIDLCHSYYVQLDTLFLSFFPQLICFVSELKEQDT